MVLFYPSAFLLTRYCEEGKQIDPTIALHYSNIVSIVKRFVFTPADLRTGHLLAYSLDVSVPLKGWRRKSIIHHKDVDEEDEFAGTSDSLSCRFSCKASCSFIQIKM